MYHKETNNSIHKQNGCLQTAPPCQPSICICDDISEAFYYRGVLDLNFACDDSNVCPPNNECKPGDQSSASSRHSQSSLHTRPGACACIATIIYTIQRQCDQPRSTRTFNLSYLRGCVIRKVYFSLDQSGGSVGWRVTIFDLTWRHQSVETTHARSSRAQPTALQTHTHYYTRSSYDREKGRIQFVFLKNTLGLSHARIGVTSGGRHPQPSRWVKWRVWGPSWPESRTPRRRVSSRVVSTSSRTRRTRYAYPMLVQCRVSVADAGPTSDQHWANVSCLLGY